MPLIITDDNYKQFIDPIVDGQKVERGLWYRDFDKQPRGALAGAASPDTIPKLPWDEIKRRWDLQVEQRSTIEDVMVHAGMTIKNQGQLPFCWMFATTSGFEAARALAGEKHVSLSPSSVASIITRYRPRGGYGVEAIQGLLNIGLAPSSVWGDTAVDKGLEDDAAPYRELYKAAGFAELYENDLQQLATSVVLRKPVSLGLNWWGHQILVVGLKFKGGQYPDFKIWNSWGTSWGDGGTGYLSPNRAKGDGVAITVAVAA